MVKRCSSTVGLRVRRSNPKFYGFPGLFELLTSSYLGSVVYSVTMVIIAAVDRSARSESVVVQAEILSNAFDAPIHAIHVLTPREFREIEEDSYQDTRQTIPMDKIRDFAEGVAVNALDAAGVNGTGVGLIGRASNEIISYATEVNAMYLVVGPRQRSPAGKALFGSVAQSLLLEADIPVVSVPAERS